MALNKFLSIDNRSVVDDFKYLSNINKILSIKENPDADTLRALIQKGFHYSVFEAVQKEVDIP